MANNILAKMAVLISANTAAFDKNLKQSEGQFLKFTNTITKAANSIGLAFGSVAAFQGLQYGVGIIQDFEARMSEVNAITQASAKEFKQLRNSALELGKATKFSAEEVAGLQVEFGKLGFSTTEILNSTKATLELATATGEDLAGSAEIAGSTLRAFNLDATEMQRVVDVMAASFNKSALGLSNFGEAIKYVAPVAAAANISLEETTAMLGVLADAGIRGSMAGTSLRKIISDVKNETGTLSERLAKMAEKGLSGADAMDEVGRTAYASLLVLTKNVDKVNEATIAYSNSSGEAEKMARLMGDNLTGDVKKLNSAFESAVLSGSGVSITLRGIVQALTDLTNLMNDSGFVQGVIGGLEAIIKQGMLIPTVVKAIRAYNAANKEVAITAEENKAIIDKVWGKPEDIKKVSNAIVDATNVQVVTLESLKQKEKELQDQFALIDVTDKKKLNNTASQIIAIEKQISTLEKLKKAEQEKDPLAGKFQFLPDLEAEGSTNANLRNEQAANDAKEFALALNQVAVSADFAGGALIRLDNATATSTQSMQAAFLDLTPVINSALSGIGHALGDAISGVRSLGDGLLSVLGGVLVQLGEMLITAGLGVEAFKKSLQSLNGYVAIAAGVALVALGSAIAGGIRNLGATSGGGSTGSVGFSGGANSWSSANNSTQDSSPQLVTVIKGQDLWVMLSNYQKGNIHTRPVG